MPARSNPYREDHMTDGVEFTPVTLHGVLCYVRPAVLRGETDGALARPEHVTDGRLNGHCFDSDSYAHAYPPDSEWPDGVIMRYHAPTGTLKDLVPASAPR